MTVRKLLLTFGAAMAALAMIVSPVSAKPSAKGNTKVAISVSDGTFGGNTTAYLNDGGAQGGAPGGAEAGAAAMTFDSSVFVRVYCYQAGELVHAHAERPAADGTAVLLLGPTSTWTEGAAECTADLADYVGGKRRWKVLADATNFSVSA